MTDKVKYRRQVELQSYMAALTEPERSDFSVAVNARYMYLRQMFYGASTPSSGLAQRICKATGGVITLNMLRPDIWGKGQ